MCPAVVYPNLLRRGIVTQSQVTYCDDIENIAYFTGRGVPNNLEVECNNITAIPSPSTHHATQMYLTQGGTLTPFGL